MSIKFKNLELQRFRSYEYLNINEFADVNYFVGKNGAGKSNILESLQLLTSMNSFRTSKVSECIRSNEENSLLKADFIGDFRAFDIKLQITNNVKKYFYNGKTKKQIELKGIIPTICFSPDDLMLIKGSSQKRRNEFDSIGEQAAKNYSQIKKDYIKILKQKNTLLKEEIDPILIEGVNDVFITVASRFLMYRLSMFKRIKPYIVESFLNISDSGSIDIKYNASFTATGSHLHQQILDGEGGYSELDLKDALQTQVQVLKEKERLAKRSLMGPHLDDFYFYINGDMASSYASQGQMRCIVLALKIAEGKFLKEITGENPIILLDDVMSELDTKHRQKLMEGFIDTSQVFITSANEEDVIKKNGDTSDSLAIFYVDKESKASYIL
jgi:DNA replication and repair protein RecF